MTMRMLTLPLSAALLAAAILLQPGVARAGNDPALEAETVKALNTVFAALGTGDVEKVRPFLAPEFQVQRSDGNGYDKESYLARSIPKIETLPTFNEMAVTRNGDIVVARFLIDIKETINGKVADRISPQIMVFRITPDGWQVVAAANFARLN